MLNLHFKALIISKIPKGDRVYKLYQVDLTDLYIGFAKVYNGTDGIWYLENLLNGDELREQTGWSSWTYYLKLDNSLAYITVSFNFFSKYTVNWWGGNL